MEIWHFCVYCIVVSPVYNPSLQEVLIRHGPRFVRLIRFFVPSWASSSRHPEEKNFSETMQDKHFQLTFTDRRATSLQAQRLIEVPMLPEHGQGF